MVQLRLCVGSIVVCTKPQNDADVNNVYVGILLVNTCEE